MYSLFMPPKKKTDKRTMSAEHKAALAEGRELGRAVKRYLDALDMHKPKRGRKRTEDSVRRRLEEVEAMLPEADPLNRVLLTQERKDLELELSSMEEKVDLTDLEEEFVQAVGPYSERKGINVETWKENGVPLPVLRRAGLIGRGRS